MSEGEAYCSLGFNFCCLEQVSVAVKHYQQGITLLNNIRDLLKTNGEWKISLRDQYQKDYSTLWRLLLADGKVMEALFSAEQGRAQGLKDLMALNYSIEANDAEWAWAWAWADQTPTA